MELLDERLTLDYMHRFLGYGTLAGDCWFIGMEEGGGGSLEEIASRLTAWKQLDRPQLADLRTFHDQIGMEKFFSEQVRLQTTWARLIRLLLSLRGKSVTLGDVRDCQARNWGSLQGDHCLLELLPLPSPSVRVWHYSAWSRLPQLRSRDAYLHATVDERISALRAAIAQHRPACVVFYGLAYRRFWQLIADARFEPNRKHRWLTTMSRQTAYLIVKHPASRGTANQYFENAGRFLATLRQGRRSSETEIL